MAPSIEASTALRLAGAPPTGAGKPSAVIEELLEPSSALYPGPDVFEEFDLGTWIDLGPLAPAAPPSTPAARRAAAVGGMPSVTGREYETGFEMGLEAGVETPAAGAGRAAGGEARRRAVRMALFGEEQQVSCYGGFYDYVIQSIEIADKVVPVPSILKAWLR